MHVGEPLIATAVAEDEFFVIHPHLMQKRGVDVMDVHGIAGDGVAKLIRFTEGRSHGDRDHRSR